MSNIGNSNEFSAQPKVVKNKQKYRTGDMQQQQQSVAKNMYNNLMFEKRIIRGNTYARVLNKENDDQNNEFMNSQSIEAQKLMNQQIIEYQKPNEQKRIERNGYLFDEDGNVILKEREHVMIETDANVESITNKAPNYEKETQTEFKIEKKVVRHYMEQKIGEDIGTQIKDGEIFDFDYEVQPLLLVLCGKALELSKMEVIQEEELKAMKKEQERLILLEKKQQQNTLRLEQEEQQRYQVIQNLKISKQSVLDMKVITHKHLISRILSKKLFENLSINVIQKKSDANAFIDKFTYQLNGYYLDWTSKEIANKLNKKIQTTNLLQKQLDEQFINLIAVHKNNVDQMLNWKQKMTQESIERTTKEEEEQRRKQQERDRKREAKRQKKVQQEIETRILSKQEEKNKIFSHLISDVDNNEKEQSQYVGILGGIIGQILFVFDQMKSQLIQLQIKEEDFLKNIFQVVYDFVKEEGGQIHLPLQDNVEQELLPFDLSLDKVLAIESKKVKEQVVNIFKKNVNSKSLNYFKQNDDQFVQILINIIVDFYFKEDQGKNIQFSYIKSINIIEKYQQQGHVIYKPSFIQEENDVDQDESNNQNLKQETESQKEIRLQNEFYDQELDDKVHLCINSDQELAVVIMHWVATVTLLKEIINGIIAKYDGFQTLNEPDKFKQLLVLLEILQFQTLSNLCIEQSVKYIINGN